MAKLKIRIFKNGESEPKITVTIPSVVLAFASAFIPKKVATALDYNGIDMHEIIRLSKNPEARGVLVEVDNHESNEKIIIALE